MRKWFKNATFEDWCYLIIRLLPHAAIVMAGMLIVFFVIDRINKPMAFMTNEFHKQLTFFLSVISIGMAIRIISRNRKIDRMARREKTAAATPAARKSAPAAKASTAAQKAAPAAKKAVPSAHKTVPAAQKTASAHKPAAQSTSRSSSVR